MWKLVYNFVSFILIKIISKDVSNGLRHVQDFYIDFIGTGASRSSQAHDNYKAKQYGQFVVWSPWGRSSAVLMCKHVSMLENTVLMPCILGLFWSTHLMNSGRIQNYSLRNLSFINMYDQWRIIKWRCWI